jgi:type I restriction enzyme R subunit
MNEAETRAELIDPALTAVGWGVVAESRIAREYQITAGRLEGAGRRGRPDIADYVLFYRGKRLAVIEAKRRDSHVTEGLGQAKAYAAKLQIRFTFATNGRGVYTGRALGRNLRGRERLAGPLCRRTNRRQGRFLDGALLSGHRH